MDQEAFPEVREPSYLVIKPEVGVVGTSIYSQLVRSTGDNLGLTSGIWTGVGAALWG